MVEGLLLALLFVWLGGTFAGAESSAPHAPYFGGLWCLAMTTLGYMVSGEGAHPYVFMVFFGVGFLGAPWISGVLEKRGFLEPRRR